MSDARVLIVDDHKLFADVIRSALEDSGIPVVGVATTWSDALAIARTDRPEVVLVDLGLPGASGVAVGKAIAGELPDAKVLVVSDSDDGTLFAEAARSGFHGCVIKDAPLSELFAAIDAAIEGKDPSSLRRAMRVTPPQRIRELGPSILVEQLTPREREVLTYVVQGANGDAIAARLGVTRNTIRTHIQSILTKLQVHTRLEAAAFAVRNGIVDVPPGRESHVGVRAG